MFLTGAALVMMLPLIAHGIPKTGGKFWGCFFVLFVYGPVNGVVQGSVFGLAGFLPNDYVAAVMVGNGLSGIVCTLVSLLLVATMPGEENLFGQALIFYGLATAVLLLCAASYTFVVSSEFFQHYEKKSRNPSTQQKVVDDQNMLLD